MHEKSIIDAWGLKFFELQQQAKQEGVGSLCVLLYDDRFDDTESKLCNHVGAGPLAVIGMAEYAKILMQRQVEQDV